ncbi:Rossmann-fold NAD(P)-binding domain-containing protein [Streptomyces mirabilis]|uniref:hypothetical protein n=1 Tax=Streptomyces mirabilis TaxID=68239 RepID=UPI003674B30F
MVEPGYFRTDFLNSSSLHASERIADYEETAAGQMRTIAPGFNHQQPGDPVKGAAVIVDAIDGGAFPVRLFLGPDTINVVTEKIDQVRAELARQHDVAVSTDHAN